MAKKIISLTILIFFALNTLFPLDAQACWWKGLPHQSPEIGGAPSDGGGFNDGKPNQPDDIADNVFLHNGDFVYKHRDLFIPSRGINIEITRTYKAQSRHNGRLGLGWDLNYNQRIVPLSNGDLFYQLGTVMLRRRFYYVDGANYVSPSEVFDTLVQNPDGTYTLTKKDGTKYHFNPNGTLSEICDRNNNKLTFTYRPEGKLPIIGVPIYPMTLYITPRLVAYQPMLTRITDPVGRQITFSYDTNGRLTKITDFTGREVTYSYDDFGHLTSFTDPLGNTTSYTYDSDRNLYTITDPKGNIFLINTYNQADQVIAQEYGDGTFYFSYDIENRNSFFTDRKGNTWTYYFDENGNPTKIVDPKKNATLKTYDANNKMLLTSVTHPEGNSTLYVYDERGNLFKITRKPKPESPEPDIITTFTYEPNYNFIKTITDPDGNTTTYYYDYEEATLGDLNGDGITTATNGNLVKIKYPSVGGQTPTTLFTYNQYGQVETVTDPNGNVTKYEYYPATGYLKRITNGYGTLNYTTDIAYDAVGNVTSITNARGHTTGFEYNFLNQLTKVISPAPFNYQTKYSYDENGNLSRVERQANETGTAWQTTTYTYTILDQLETITDDLGDVTTFGYDSNGNRASIQDAELNTTTYEYEERNLLWKVTDALGNLTEYAYDANGNLSQIKDARANVTTYLYDDFDRLKLTTYQDGTTESYTYDRASNLTVKTDQGGQIISYTYDALNRLDQKSYPDATTADYAYDKGSRLTSVADPNGTITYSYDEVNRVTSVAYPGGKTVSYQYDGVGNRTRLTYSDATFITYEYDELNRVTDIRNQADQAIAHYSYDPLSRRTQLDLLNNTQDIYQYDHVNRLTSLVNQTTTPTTISSFSYTYDKVGNRVSMTTQQGTHNYTYDNIYQLTNVDYPEGFASPDTIFNYDSVGNRSSTVDGGTTTYTTNNMNQYTSVAGTTYTYDANGNLTSDGTKTYQYDYENRLTQATTPTTTATYKYDPFGRRIEKNVGGIVTKYIYDGDQVILETDSSGTIQAKYIYGTGIDEPILMEKGGETYYYHFDGLGSVTNLTDSTASTIESYSYDVNGQPLTTSSIGNPYMFTGRRLDPETGLYYYRARYYSPNIGRFLQRDEYTWGPDDVRILFRQDDIYAQIERKIIFVMGTLKTTNYNRYSYCGNDPINFIDPWGFEKKGFLPPGVGNVIVIGGTTTLAIPGPVDDAVYWTGVGIIIGGIAVYFAGKAVINYFRNDRSYRRPHSPTNPKNRRPKPGQPKKPKPEKPLQPAPPQHNRPPDPDDILDRGRFPHDPGSGSPIPAG